MRRALRALARERPDVVIAAVHGGIDRDPQTGEMRPGEKPGENPAWTIAEKFPQLAAVVYGHSHQREEGRRVNGVLLVQPRNWGMEVARVDLALERPADGRWKLAGATSRLLAVEPADDAGPARDGDRPPVPRGGGEVARPAGGPLGRRALGRARALRGLRPRRRHPRGAAALRARGREPHRSLQPAPARRAGAGHRARGRGALRLRQRALRGGGRRPHAPRGARERGALLPHVPRAVLRAGAARRPGRARIQLRHGAGRRVRDRPHAAGGKPRAPPALSRRAAARRPAAAHRPQQLPGRRLRAATRCSAARRSSTAVAATSAT